MEYDEEYFKDIVDSSCFKHSYSLGYSIDDTSDQKNNQDRGNKKRGRVMKMFTGGDNGDSGNGDSGNGSSGSIVSKFGTRESMVGFRGLKSHFDDRYSLEIDVLFLLLLFVIAFYLGKISSRLEGISAFTLLSSLANKNLSLAD